MFLKLDYSEIIKWNLYNFWYSYFFLIIILILTNSKINLVGKGHLNLYYLYHIYTENIFI